MNPGSQSQNNQKKQVRMVKLIAKQQLVLTSRGEQGQIVETPVSPEQEFEVPENEVADWTTPMLGQTNFVGERFNVSEQDRYRTVKAVLAPSVASNAR